MTTAPTPLKGDALYAALAASAPFSVWRLGGAGLAVRTPETLLYVDPFLAPQGSEGWVRQQPRIVDSLPPADLILATHEHGDHTDPVALTPQAREGSGLFASLEACVRIARDAGFPAERTRILQPDDSFQQDDLTITALKAIDAEIEDELAYLIHDRSSGTTVYHGGDSSMSSQFDLVGRQHRIDVCCLSVGLESDGFQYYLSPEDSIRAARMLGARVLIPLHWDLWTKNGFPASRWEPIIATTTDPQIVLLPPGGRWLPG